MKLKTMNDAVRVMDKLIDDLRYPSSTESKLDQMDEISLHLEVLRDWLAKHYD